jgi:hypothetical protein
MQGERKYAIKKDNEKEERSGHSTRLWEGPPSCQIAKNAPDQSITLGVRHHLLPNQVTAKQYAKKTSDFPC